MQRDYQESVVTPLSSEANDLAAMFDEPATLGSGSSAPRGARSVERAHTAPDLGGVGGLDDALPYESMHLAVEKVQVSSA